MKPRHEWIAIPRPTRIENCFDAVLFTISVLALIERHSFTAAVIGAGAIGAVFSKYFWSFGEAKLSSEALRNALAEMERPDV